MIESAPLGRLAVRGAGRLALGACLLALAALIVLGGGGALRGALGSLFGFSAGTRPPAEARGTPVAAQPVVPRPALKPSALPLKGGGARQGVHRRRLARPRASLPPRAPAPPSSPAEPPTNPPPAVPGGGPLPGSGAGLVSSAGAALQTTANSLPAPAQPVAQPAVQQVESTLTTACTALGGCP